MTVRVRVTSPASLSNLGPGFDILGLALADPADTVEAEASDRPGVEIVDVTGDEGLLSRDPRQNVAGVAAADVLARAARTSGVAPAATGLRLWLTKGIPIASGLGGSAASSVAGAVAANEVLGRPFAPLELVESALAGEAVAAISAHGDNVLPCLLGGIVLVRSLAPLDVVSLPVPPGLHLAVVHPHCQVPTSEARALLKDLRWNLSDAVANAANVGSFVSALHTGDLQLLGRSVADRLVEPVRARLIPGFDRVKAAAQASGALACSISGSGPTVFAFACDERSARRAAAAMEQAFADAAGLASDVYVGQVNTQGTRSIRHVRSGTRAGL
jgi:homoserine kinase